MEEWKEAIVRWSELYGVITGKQTLEGYLQTDEATMVEDILSHTGAQTGSWYSDSCLKAEVTVNMAYATEIEQRTNAYVESRPKSTGVLGNLESGVVLAKGIRNAVKEISELLSEGGFDGHLEELTLVMNRLEEERSE